MAAASRLKREHTARSWRTASAAEVRPGAHRCDARGRSRVPLEQPASACAKRSRRHQASNPCDVKNLAPGEAPKCPFFFRFQVAHRLLKNDSVLPFSLGALVRGGCNLRRAPQQYKQENQPPSGEGSVAFDW
jgi:hypothetical protein